MSSSFIPLLQNFDYEISSTVVLLDRSWQLERTKSANINCSYSFTSLAGRMSHDEKSFNFLVNINVNVIVLMA